MNALKITIIFMAITAMACANAETSQKFNAEDISVINHTESITLAGTLTTPTHSSPRAVIVMATGSGAQNRDEEIMGMKPFKVIAEHLSSNGYAVLRMDDRGTAQSGGDFTSATTDDFVTDITAGISAMQTRFPQLPVGIIGHSEGGNIAIKTAVHNPQCAFIVTLAAPAWSGDSIIMSQARAMAIGLTGTWDGEQQQREILDIVKSGLTGMQARMSLSYLMAKLYGANASLPQAKEAIAKQIDILVSPWYRNMVKYDPAADISAVKCRWLAINGSKDTQVLPGNLETIKTLNPTAETILVEGHNHLLQPCITGLVNEYATLPQPPSSKVLDIILEWLNTSVE